MSDPYVFTVAKADPISKSQAALRDSTGFGGGPLETPGAVLHITADLRTVRETLPVAIWRAANLDIHITDAQQVVAALAHLPQGTLDQVLVLLLQQRASLLRVRMPESFPVAHGGFPDQPPAAFRAMVRMLIGRFNLAGPEYPDATKAAAVLWESLRPRAEESA